MHVLALCKISDGIVHVRYSLNYAMNSAAQRYCSVLFAFLMHSYVDDVTLLYLLCADTSNKMNLPTVSRSTPSRVWRARLRTSNVCAYISFHKTIHLFYLFFHFLRAAVHRDTARHFQCAVQLTHEFLQPGPPIDLAGALPRHI